MEVRDGFIVSIFNYCDRWCEVCAFTSRCRLFAEVAEIEASLDPGLKSIVEAPLRPEEAPAPPPPWMQEMIAEMNEAARKIAAGEDSPSSNPPPPEHLAIEMRAKRYCLRAHQWLGGRTYAALDPADPHAVIGWFETMIPAKIHRAIHGLAEEWDDSEGLADHDGSAKVALLGIERSHAAWTDLIALGLITHTDAHGFLADLVWLRDALERVFPKARAFVRPAFDEPDEVAMLLAQERGG